ncbi:PREDICTED: ATP synthase subunit s-like protein [Nicrophorus vespilloides]|uniref:ATP synthase subunit s-like protein n=1 Tax=Nicrophorus vespilloides TaxID=110193 RepID=A0ABM1MJN9_NICVS|nr:PREDICTED: ATP synthase subunit s-like protein [Nicrophorus vespilloides]XP_017778755.1 PREDICTED: ATP synthase subunit s-like protein [Nicrophorus vespilloides]
MYKLIRSLRNLPATGGVQVARCSTSEKNVVPKKMMPGDLVKTPKVTREEIARSNETTAGDMSWRTPWHEKEGQYYSMLKAFYSEDNQTNVLKMIQQPINLTPNSIKNWFAKRKVKTNIALQQYIPERNATLGNDLAAAHFTVYRGGAVKFFDSDKWIKANKFNEYDLPTIFTEDLYLQAIDCTDMDLYYEGLINFKELHGVEWLSLNGCQNLDDWALDRVGHVFSHSLLYLDLRNIPLITHRGIGALSKMDKLKILYVDNIFASREFEMTCLMLQELKPDLDIRVE